MKRTPILGLLVLTLGLLIGAVTACSDPPPPRDLDAYVCGDERLNEDDREDDVSDLRSADCFTIYDETNADDDDIGEPVGTFERTGDAPNVDDDND